MEEHPPGGERRLHDVARAARTADEVLESLVAYEERDDAIQRLEREIIDDRLNKLGSTREA
jgi:hypothetical protein